MQLGEVIFVRLSRRGANQHPAEAVYRHAAHVQRGHARWRGDADPARMVADRKVRDEGPQLRAFARAAGAGEEAIVPTERGGAETILRCEHRVGQRLVARPRAGFEHFKLSRSLSALGRG